MPGHNSNSANTYADQITCPDASGFTGHFLESEGNLGLYHAQARFASPATNSYIIINNCRNVMSESMNDNNSIIREYKNMRTSAALIVVSRHPKFITIKALRAAGVGNLFWGVQREYAPLPSPNKIYLGRTSR